MTAPPIRLKRDRQRDLTPVAASYTQPTPRQNHNPLRPDGKPERGRACAMSRIGEDPRRALPREIGALKSHAATHKSLNSGRPPNPAVSEISDSLRRDSRCCSRSPAPASSWSASARLQQQDLAAQMADLFA